MDWNKVEAPSPLSDKELAQRLTQVALDGAYNFSDEERQWLHSGGSRLEALVQLMEENERLHLGITDALHWLARGDIDEADRLLCAALSTGSESEG